MATAIALLGSAASHAGPNDTRTLTLHHIHTGEDITITYKRNGQFDEAALKRLNLFVRDWRKNEEVTMAPELYDMMWEVKEAVGYKGAIHIVCGYRAPGTNEMLRGRSRQSGVAKTSLHMQGKAMDFSLPGADVAQVRAAALRIQGGGVGYYPTSGVPFVHMDVGNVRHWPRMTREQLAKVFPDGRTLHVPTDGQPMPGYELALADQERGALGVSRSASTPRNFLASLFSASSEEEETSDAKPATSRAATPSRRAGTVQLAAAETKAAETPAPAAVNVPLPQARPAIAAVAAAPAATFQMASAESKPVPAPAPRSKAVTDETMANSLTPSASTDIFTARGYWQGLPEAPTATTEQAQAISAARRVAAARPVDPKPAETIDTTAAIGPFARTDRNSPELALSYAPANDPVAPRLTATPRPAIVSTPGATTVAAAPTTRSVSAQDRLNDPWIRGVVMASSVQRSMTITIFGAPDFRALRPYIQKPANAVMMTFAKDPNPGLTTDRFTGSAIAFQPTVTFGVKTAELRQ
jgi:uncharacterized protein YcbK (DUF882 family)